MNRARLLAIFLVIITLTSLLSIGGSAQLLGSDTVEGAAIVITDEEELDRLRNAAEKAPGDFGERNHAFLLMNSEAQYVVFTDTKPKNGLAEVKGRVVERRFRPVDFILADQVSFTQKGKSASFDDVVSNPSSYEYELVRVSTSANSISYLLEMGPESDSRISQQIVSEVGGPEPRELVGRPGLTSRENIRQLSESSSPISRVTQRYESRSAIGITHSSVGMWSSSKATLDVIVLPDLDESLPGISGELPDTGRPILYVVDRQIQSSQRTESLSELTSGRQNLDGAVVSTRSDGFGVSISVQESLLDAARCGSPRLVTIPGVGCIPVPADMVIHTGVLYDGAPESAADVMFYAGISNMEQHEPVSIERGRFDITGRMKSAQSISSALPDTSALITYEMTRVSDSTAVPDEVKSFSSESTDRMRQQLTTGEVNSDDTGDVSSKETSSQQSEQGDLNIRYATVATPEIELGQSTEVRITVENTGTAPAETTLQLRVADVETSKTVSLPPGESETVGMTVTPGSEGDHAVSVNEEDIGTVSVDSASQRPVGSGSDGYLPEFIVLIGAGFVIAGGYMTYQSSRMPKFLKIGVKGLLVIVGLLLAGTVVLAPFMLILLIPLGLVLGVTVYICIKILRYLK